MSSSPKSPRSGMRCRACGGTEVVVIDSRANAGATTIRRRRKCACGFRWTTYERDEEVVVPPLTLILAVTGRKIRVTEVHSTDAA